MLSGRISRNIVKIFFDLTLVAPVKIPIFMFLLPRLIACASQPDRNMTLFTLNFSLDIILYVAMWKGYATGNNGKELYWILIKLLPERVKKHEINRIFCFFFCERSKFISSRENITDGVHSMK